MSTINMSSIIAKAQKCMGASSKKKEISNHIDKLILGGVAFSTGGKKSIYTPEEAADKFISVLRQELLSNSGVSGGIGDTAISALSELNHTSPYKTGDGKYVIEVYFSGDLTRESLDPSNYDGVINIAALLNNGYTASHAVHGMWHGEEAWSLPIRGGAHFIQHAIHDFMGNYANEYGVTNIEIDEIYK